MSPSIQISSREIDLQLVYFGPAYSGKTTNLEYIYEKLSAEQRGPMVRIAPEVDRRLGFDFVSRSIGRIRGFTTRCHVHTVPGLVFHDANWKLVLQHVSGIVFCADSRIERTEANEEAMDRLKRILAELGRSFAEVPMVIQYNKRDAPEAASLDELRSILNPQGVPDFGAIARTGEGVFDTAKALVRLVVEELKNG